MYIESLVMSAGLVITGSCGWYFVREARKRDFFGMVAFTTAGFLLWAEAIYVGWWIFKHV